MKKTDFILPLLLLMVTTALSAQPKIIAHRGYWDTEGSAQNSLTALTKAAEAGCYGSEFDVWMTADEELIVYHDKKLNKRPIVEMTAAEVCSHRLPNGERIPTLTEYLNLAQQLPNIHLVLELKPHPNRALEAKATEKCVQMVEQAGLSQRTDYISFSLEACRDFHRLAPASKVFYLKGNLSPEELKSEGFAGANYNFIVYLLHPSWLSECRRLGLETNVWTVNSDSLLRRYIKKGIGYITTNRPEEALEIIKN